jgi:hypothetical protein
MQLSGKTHSLSELLQEELMKGSEDWDTAVALAFATEQSTAAAQLLTSEKIAPLDALRLAYDEYISSLLENAHFLPLGITAKLLSAQSKYVHAKERGISTERARRLASELMVILRQMAPLFRAEPHRDLHRIA